MTHFSAGRETNDDWPYGQIRGYCSFEANRTGIPTARWLALNSVRGLSARMWQLSIEDDRGTTTVVQLVRTEYSLGRAEGNAIRLTERNVSRRHAKLTKQGSRWFLTDSGSYNGCFVNGVRVVQTQPLGPQDVIHIGDYRVEVQSDDLNAGGPNAGPNRANQQKLESERAAEQHDRLVLVVGPTPGRHYLLVKGTQLLGRADDCGISIHHPSVSRVHAELRYLAGGRYELIDRDSSNGLRVNGVELRRALLDARDLVEVGDVVLKYIPAGQSYHLTPEESRRLAALLGVEIGTVPPQSGATRTHLWLGASRRSRWAIVGLSLAVLATFAVILVNSPRVTGIRPALGLGEPDPGHEALLAAKALLDKGNVEAAHQKAATIPETSNVRADPLMRTIEARWADSIFGQVEGTTDPEHKRELLDRVAKAPSVDSLRRRQASDMLGELQSKVIDVSALPDRDPSLLPTTTTVPARSPNAVPGSGAAAKLSSSPTTKSNSNSATLPSRGADSSIATLVASGDLKSATMAKDQLRARVAAGTATDKDRRLLRALCRQLGDPTCSD